MKNMKNIKTFENFNYMSEDVELQSSDQMSSEEKKEIIDATAATTKVELANKSEFSQKLKSKVAQAQAQDWQRLRCHRSESPYRYREK
jgi:hypothetical protein